MTQVAPSHGNRHYFRFLVAFMYQAISVIAHQMRVIPLRIRNPTPRGQSVEQINRSAIRGYAACCLISARTFSNVSFVSGTASASRTVAAALVPGNI